MSDYIRLRFEGTEIQAIFREPFTMEWLIAKAASVLKISETQVQAFYQAVYVNQEEREIAIVDTGDLQHAVDELKSIFEIFFRRVQP